MASKIQVVNGALRLIGARRIVALDGSSKEAREADDAWDKVRDAVLRSHPWNFAMRRAALAASATDPAFEFTSAYPIPSDCLRVWEVFDLGPTDWQVENGTDHGVPVVILANTTGALQIRYISRVEDVSAWDALAIRALECELALTLAETITNSSSVFQQIAALRDDAVKSARNSDGMENPATDLYDDTFLTARV